MDILSYALDSLYLLYTSGLRVLIFVIYTHCAGFQFDLFVESQYPGLYLFKFGIWVLFRLFVTLALLYNFFDAVYGLIIAIIAPECKSRLLCCLLASKCRLCSFH